MYTRPFPGQPPISTFALSEQIIANMRDRCSVAPGSATAPQPLVVGVSGGADSVALLHVLASCRTAGYELHAAHFDHGLRPDSDDDAAFVADIARWLEVPLHIGCAAPGTLAAAPGNLEQNARRARYAFLGQTALNVTHAPQVPVVVTAHHALDQAETILLHLVRGSGLTGLGGMRWYSPMALDAVPSHDTRTVYLVRPLLDCEPAELRTFLAEHGLKWREDSTNAEPHLVRNRLRREVLPLLQSINPQVTASLGRTAAILQDDADRLAALDARLLERLLLEPLASTTESPPRVVLDLRQLLTQSPSAQRGVVRRALAQLSGTSNDISLALVDGLRTELARHLHAGGPHPLTGELAWTVVSAGAAQLLALSIHHRDVVPLASPGPQLPIDEAPRRLALPDELRYADWTLYVRIYARAELPSDWQAGDRPWRAFLAAEAGGELRLAALGGLPPGQRLAPLGMNGRHRAIGDLMTDAKIPAAHRAGWPVVMDGHQGTVLWVCGLRTSHHGRITPSTQRVIELSWVPSAPPNHMAEQE